ncbi:hypothetical protein DXA13_18740 [Clostridium sp. AM58-1XD]|nr:hypothetical protein DXA13_18740 [Clostridium sp. AM58-1XD]
MIFPQKNIKSEEESGNDLVLHPPRAIGIAGIVTLVIGLLLSVFCYLDYLNGNETASVGIALGFLMIPGIAGILLVLYSCRLVTVKGEDIVFRDFLLRRHRCRLSEITKVIWSADGYVLMGKTGKLFKLYDDFVTCEQLFIELEKRGVELDIPGRTFGAGRLAAIHPCPDKRRFTVRSCNCSLRYGGKIKIEGTNLVFCRRFQKMVCYTVSELTGVHIKEKKDGRIIISIFYQNHRLLFKINAFIGDCQDTRFVFALVRHLKESGVPLKGMENVGEDIHCMMRKQFINREDAERILMEEYERILPTIRKYETDLEELGFQLMHGTVDREKVEYQVKVLFPDQMVDRAFVLGYYLCFTKEGRFVYDKKQKCPLYQCRPVMTGKPEYLKAGSDYDEVLKDLIYFEAIPEPVIRYTMEYFLMLIKKKRIYISEYKSFFNSKNKE